MAISKKESKHIGELINNMEVAKIMMDGISPLGITYWMQQYNHASTILKREYSIDVVQYKIHQEESA